MPNFKDLHKKWKKAKDDAKGQYDYWTALYMQVSVGNVSYGGPAWPKFNMDLGPNLDKLEKNKDVEKSKVKAIKAVEQYGKDIQAFYEAAEKTDADSKDKLARQDAALKEIKKLEEVRKEIAKALKE